MKKTTRVLFGILIIAIGALLILNAVGVLDFDIFFKGWWTIFIILPSIFGFISRPNWGSVCIIALGVFILLQAQGLIDWAMFWKLCVAALAVIIGLCIILSVRIEYGHRTESSVETINREGKNIKSFKITFGEQKLSMEGQDFEGADINATFGAMNLNLRDAVISDDVLIRVNASFAGVRIWLPYDVNVEVRSSATFGGVDNKADGRHGAHTVIIDADCTFAGVELR